MNTGDSTKSGFAADTLVRRARGGDREAVGRLLDRYRNYLRLLAKTSLDRKLAVKVDASDVVQEAMLNANERFGQFRGGGEGELVAWLRQILTRKLIDAARRYALGAGRQIDRERSLDESVARSSQNLAQLLPDRGPSPSTVAQERESGVVLADALAELGPEHRDVIILRSLRELDWKEVGRAMNRTPGAARMLWARALVQLKPRIEARL